MSHSGRPQESSQHSALGQFERLQHSIGVQAGHGHPLTSAARAGDDLDLTAFDIEQVRKKPNQLCIGFAVNRRGGESDLQRLSMQTGQLRRLRVGLDVDG